MGFQTWDFSCRTWSPAIVYQPKGALTEKKCKKKKAFSIIRRSRSRRRCLSARLQNSSRQSSGQCLACVVKGLFWRPEERPHISQELINRSHYRRPTWNSTPPSEWMLLPIFLTKRRAFHWLSIVYYLAHLRLARYLVFLTGFRFPLTLSQHIRPIRLGLIQKGHILKQRWMIVFCKMDV